MIRLITKIESLPYYFGGMVGGFFSFVTSIDWIGWGFRASATAAGVIIGNYLLKKIKSLNKKKEK